MTTHEQVAQDLPLYALGTLTDDDRRSVDEHLRECARCRFELHMLREDMARLSLVNPDEADIPVPEHSHHAQLTTMITLDSAEAPSKSRLYWLAAVPAILCLVMGGMLVELRTQNTNLSEFAASIQAESNADHVRAEQARELDGIIRDQATYHFTIESSASQPVSQLQVMYNSAYHKVLIIGSHLPRLAPGRDYQIWLSPSAGTPPISAGTFTPDANGNVVSISQRLPDSLQASILNVTIENATGTSAPTSDPVFHGK